MADPKATLYPEQNLTTKADFVASKAQIREVEFVEMFGESIKKLIEALGVTRKIPKQAGTVLRSYKASGQLVDGTQIEEGAIIPLSKYVVEPVDYADITIDKYRKATSVENIAAFGFNQAVNMTTDKMLKDVQKTIKTKFFNFIETAPTVAAETPTAVEGVNLQAVLAQAWGQLQVLFEDDDIAPVYFINPLDIADYLATAQITTQSAFGFTYVEDFLGLGTVILNSAVTPKHIYATAKDNIVLYYIPVNGADIAEAFDFTTDATGYIGIKESPNYDNLTSSDTVMTGITLFAERMDGIVSGEIKASQAQG